MKKIISLLTLILSASALAGCGKGNGADDNLEYTKISIKNFGGGVGTEWLNLAAEEFKESVKDKSYEKGKKGVGFEIDGNSTGDVAGGIERSTYNMFFSEAGRSVYDMANSGLLMDISDVVQGNAAGEDKPIASKIDSSAINALKGKDGKFYSLPHYEWYPGLTFNKKLFDEKKLYFAAPDTEAKIPYSCTFGDASFIANATAKKSCGNDGVYDTEDDGLPTSLQELLILCNKMKYECSMVPLIVSGDHKDYTHYFIEGLLSSLGGKESAQTFYTFNGTQDIVSGTSASTLWGTSIPDVNYTATTITEFNGHLTRQTKEKYYGMAFLQAAQNAGFFDNISEGTGVMPRGVQHRLIFGSQEQGTKDYGIMFDGSYWYNEATNEFNDYKKRFGDEERELGWMPLPTLVNGSATVVADPSQARKTALMDMGYSFAYINKNIETLWKRPGIGEACKDFLRFLYSDAQLIKFTQRTGVAKAAISYDVASATTNLSTFQKQFLAQKISSGVVSSASDNIIFLANKDTLKLNNEGTIWRAKIGGANYTDAFLPLIGGKTAYEVFSNSKMTQEYWNTLRTKAGL